MGVDFIRGHSGQPWRKRWDKGLDRLKMQGLFDVQFSDQQRTVTADLDCVSPLKVGDQLVVQREGLAVIVCIGHHRVGEIPSVPADMLKAIADNGGMALGVVERVGLFGKNAEVSIR